MFHDVINQTNVDYAALLWWDFMNNVKQKKEAIQYPRFNKLIIADLMKKFLDIPQRIEEDYHSIKDDIPLVSVYTTEDVHVRGMLILDEFLTEEIRATDDFKEYETVFINVDVLINQPQPVVSTQGMHRSTPSARRTPTLTASPQGRKRDHNDDDSEDRLEPKSHKDNSKHVDDDDDKDNEKVEKEEGGEMGSLETRTEKTRQGYMIQNMEQLCVTAKQFWKSHKQVNQVLHQGVSQLAEKATKDLIESNLKPCIAAMIIEYRDDFHSKVEETVIDEDEVIPKVETPKLIIELQNVNKRVLTIYDYKRMRATLNDVLSNQFKNAEEPQRNLNEPPRTWGKADVILGIRIKHESNGIAISQSHYIEKVLKKFNYSDCTPVSTLMDTYEKLMRNKGQVVSQLEYSRVIGYLMYAMTCTRPYIAFVVGKLSRYTSNPATGKEAEWLKNLLLEIPMWVKPIAPISIRCDSAATLANAYSKMYNRKSKHLGVRHNMIRELITNGVISIEFLRSQQNLANHLTKVLARDLRTEAHVLHIIPRMYFEPADKEDEVANFSMVNFFEKVLSRSMIKEEPPMVWSQFRYGISKVSDTAYWGFLEHEYAVSSLMDTSYWLSE
nr:zinc finger, CCHC-type [Tanacetum cinerariifolium]